MTNKIPHIDTTVGQDIDPDDKVTRLIGVADYYGYGLCGFDVIRRCELSYYDWAFRATVDGSWWPDGTDTVQTRNTLRRIADYLTRQGAIAYVHAPGQYEIAPCRFGELCSPAPRSRGRKHAG